jgi:murein L,D-transpeptidase YcbB/YkuD
MPGSRVDRVLASTAIAVLLSLPATAIFAGSENGPEASTAPRQESPADNANQPAVSDPAQKASNDAPAGATTPAEAATKTAEAAAATSNPAEKPPGDAKPAAATDTAPAAPSQTGQPGGGEAKPAVSTDTAKPNDGNKSTAEGKPADAKSGDTKTGDAKPTDAKPADAKPADAKAGDAAVTSAPSPASPEAAAPVVIAAPPSPDALIAEQLHELGNGKFDRITGSKKDRTPIEAFYSSRNYAPLWITDGKVNARATAAIGYLRHVDADGLDPADYPAPNFVAVSAPADLADAEIKLTTAVVTYAHHASVGRVHWSRVSADIEYSTPVAEPGDVLAAIAGASDVAAALDSYEPQTSGYRALKAKLADIRGGKIDKSKPPIAGGPVLKVGMQDERVPMLRERLGVGGNDSTTYDKALAEAVKKFQQQHDLAATGTLGAATLDALNGRAQPDRVTDIILANMERWRWMPHRLPDTYVIVNLPDFTLRVMHNGKQLWTTRIVIGKPEMPTPIMTADMKYITVNPTWNVPPSIVNHEYLPALAQDPTVLERMGLRVDRNADGSIHIYQPPGDKNALGRIRFNFPNKFLVYQHDTPDKYMFANDKRAFSHGCMRVQDPVHYAEVLLSLVRPNDGYTEDRIRRMFGSSENDIQFPTFVSVNLTYQTAFVDDAGKLELRDDVYGRDRALLAVLKGSERKVADIPVEHKVDISHREVMAIPDEPSWFGGRSAFGGARGYYQGGGYYPGGGSYYGGGNFFSRLFGGFSAPPAPPAPLRHRNGDRPRKVTHSGQTVER